MTQLAVHVTAQRIQTVPRADLTHQRTILVSAFATMDTSSWEMFVQIVIKLVRIAMARTIITVLHAGPMASYRS